MNILIVGTNFISDRFAEAARSVERVSLYGVYSRALATGREFASRHAIEHVFTDLDAALADPAIDAVYVASPTLCHAEQSCRAMRAGKHVLCEKMLAAELSELYEMRACARECGVVLLEAMRPAHDPAYDTVRDCIAMLGTVRRATLEFCQYSSRYDAFKSGTLTNAFDPHLKNSSLADIGIYPLHVAMMLFGEPDSVTARSVFLHNGFEGSGMLTLGYPNTTVSIVYSKISDSVNASVIEGELGSLTINKISAPTSLTLHLRGSEPREIFVAPDERNMHHEISAFRDMTEGKRSAEPYLDITERAQRIVDYAYTAAGTRTYF